MKDFWKFLSFILFGWIIGYFVKDNLSKPDEINKFNIKQKGKGNVIDKIKTKFQKRKRFRLFNKK